jgi:Ca-activated chloride channel homolog
VSLSGPWRFELLGYPAGLAQPAYLGLALIALGLLALGLAVAVRRPGQAGAIVPARLVEALAPGISVARPVLESVFYGLGLLLLSVALAQPQCGSQTELTKRQGIDLVVALDASASMLARDVSPNRLERAKLELITLLDELKGDRVGIVVFAGDAFVQSPLTTDYAAAKLFLRAIDPEQMQQGGTDIGGALALAKQVLENADRGAQDRVVVLLSDGEDLQGEVDASVGELVKAGIRIYAVGIGSATGEPIPLYDRRGETVIGFKKDATGQTVLTRLDRAGLARIAEATGGEFFHHPRGVAVSEVLERIERLQKAEFESRLTVRYDERFQYFAGPGLALLVVGMLIRPSRRRQR